MYVVAKARAPEESIQDQIDKILDASATQRYKIEVMPGIYAETIVMEEFVDVVAPYGRVNIQPPSGTAGVTMASNSMLQGVQVDQTNQGASATGIVIGALTNVTIEDVWVTDGGAGDTGISDASTGTSVIIRKCHIEDAATSYQKTGTGTTWFADCRCTAATDGIEIDANAGTLNLMDNELMATNPAANVDLAAATVVVNSFGNTLNGDVGFNIGDNTNAWVYSHDDKFTAVTHAGAGHMVASEEPQTFRVHNGMKIQDAITRIAALGDASDTKRYTIEAFSGEYNEAVTMAQYVDLIGESNQSVVISQANATVISCANNSRVKSVRVELTAGEGGVVCVLADDVAAFLEGVTMRATAVSGYNYCLHTTDTGGVTAFGLDCYASGDNGYAAALSATGTHRIYDSTFESASTSRQDIWVGAATVYSYNNKLLTTGWYISDLTTSICLSHGDDYTDVTFEGTDGLFADLTGCRLYTCASGLTIGDWVYASDNETVAEADADALATMPTIGVINYKPSTTTCYVKNYGYYYDANANSGHGDAFVAGEEYWVSATPGEITITMHPVWPQRAGVAASTQRFKILIGDNLGLVHCNEYECATGTIVVDQWVYITTTNDVVGLADSDAAATMPAIGVCVAILVVGAPNDTILVKLRGKNSVSDTTAAWVASDDIYISATAGAITNIIPGGIIQKVAEVKHFTSPTLIYEIAD